MTKKQQQQKHVKYKVYNTGPPITNELYTEKWWWEDELPLKFKMVLFSGSTGVGIGHPKKLNKNEDFWVTFLSISAKYL